jgi:hypothetical protein
MRLLVPPRAAVVTVASILTLFLASTIADATSPITCTVLKRSDSAYWYKEQTWAGVDPTFKRVPAGSIFREFGPKEFSHHQPIGYIFSGLDGNEPRVNQFYADAKSYGALDAAILNRPRDHAVLIMWPLPQYVETRFALIDLKAKKAVIGQMGAGHVALGMAAMAADCE